MKNTMCNVPDNILEILQKDIAEIKVALLGNEYNPVGGLLYRTSDVEKKYADLRMEFDKLKNRYDKIIWTVTGGTTAVAIIANVLFNWLTKVIE